MVTINEIREKIVQAIQKGEDTLELQKQLRQAKIDAETNADLLALKDIAEKRKEWELKAKAITEKVRNQNKAVESFLQQRDKVLSPFAELIAQVEALQKLQDDCFAQYDRPLQDFRSEVGNFPKGYLPDALAVTELCQDGFNSGREIVPYLAEKLRDLQKILATVTKLEQMLPHLLSVDDGVGRDESTGTTGGNTPTDSTTATREVVPADQEAEDETDTRCSICLSPHRAEIEADIADGVSLRTIENAFGYSRSALSRHSKHANISQEIKQGVT